MGEYNSSERRIRPTFRRLFAQDCTGATWLPRLLRLASQGTGDSAFDELGALDKASREEFVVDPSLRYLEWLIEHPEALSTPPACVWARWSSEAQEKRKALLSGDRKVQREGLAAFKAAYNKADSTRGVQMSKWWRLEGRTRVDYALITSRAVVFVEGKWTEIGPSERVAWYKGRNQVLRNLDCAATFAQRTGRPHYYVLVIADGAMLEARKLRQRKLEEIRKCSTVERSLPHLGTTEREDLLTHFLGVLTWEQLAGEMFAPEPAPWE